MMQKYQIVGIQNVVHPVHTIKSGNKIVTFSNMREVGNIVH